MTSDFIFQVFPNIPQSATFIDISTPKYTNPPKLLDHCQLPLQQEGWALRVSFVLLIGILEK